MAIQLSLQFNQQILFCPHSVALLQRARGFKTCFSLLVKYILKSQSLCHVPGQLLLIIYIKNDLQLEDFHRYANICMIQDFCGVVYILCYYVDLIKVATLQNLSTPFLLLLETIKFLTTFCIFISFSNKTWVFFLCSLTLNIATDKGQVGVVIPKQILSIFLVQILKLL